MVDNDDLGDNFGNAVDFEKFPMVIGTSMFGMGVIPVIFPIKNIMIK